MADERFSFYILPLDLGVPDGGEDARLLVYERCNPFDPVDLFTPVDYGRTGAIYESLVVDRVLRWLGCPTLLRIGDVVGQKLGRILRLRQLDRISDSSCSSCSSVPTGSK